ncbi:inner membrane protein import complex subunit Tim54-domain-containing protein [Gaertneriomyces semiglobifer]|nr:inner membrane protein import complex subunit Tim54-domain-containing protein [Gaertneriomyces semiglobifer]
MSFVQSVKAKLPSRNWLIFLGTTSTIGSLALYDKYNLRQVRAELEEQAAQIAKEPLKTFEPVRKVHVYVAPTHWARYWFKQYVKPVFDAAALDYEVVEPKAPSLTRKAVRESVWAGKDELRSRPVNHQYEPDPLAWLGNPLERPKYRPDEGLVAVGPNAWREILLGLNEGMLAERPIVIADETAASTTSAETTDSTPQEALLELSPANIPALALPSIGFISGKNQAGWKGFPSRIYGWFTERDTAKEVGQEALKIALGRVRPFRQDDIQRGATDLFVHPEWTDEDKKIVENVRIDDGVVGKLHIYD